MPASACPCSFVAGAGNQAHFGEGAVLIGIEEVHGAVVGHVDVGVAVAVVVGQRDAQSLALECDAGRLGDRRRRCCRRCG